MEITFTSWKKNVRCLYACIHNFIGNIARPCRVETGLANYTRKKFKAPAAFFRLNFQTGYSDTLSESLASCINVIFDLSVFEHSDVWKVTLTIKANLFDLFCLHSKSDKNVPEFWGNFLQCTSLRMQMFLKWIRFLLYYCYYFFGSLSTCKRFCAETKRLALKTRLSSPE